SLRILRSMPSLTKLHAYVEGDLNDTFFAPLADLKRLKRLSLNCASYPGLHRIGGLPLKHLTLSQPHPLSKPPDLTVLPPLPSVRRLTHDDYQDGLQRLLSELRGWTSEPQKDAEEEEEEEGEEDEQADDDDDDVGQERKQAESQARQWPLPLVVKNRSA